MSGFDADKVRTLIEWGRKNPKATVWGPGDVTYSAEVTMKADEADALLSRALVADKYEAALKRIAMAQQGRTRAGLLPNEHFGEFLSTMSKPDWELAEQVLAEVEQT